MEEENSLRNSVAFREYSTGERTKIKYPWVTIIISGILVAVAMILTNWLGTALHGNPYSFNFILALYGLPAGFACAWRNDTLTATYFVVTLIVILASPTSALGMISSIGQLAIASAVIAVFFICVTFASGAMIGTFIKGVRDSKS
ncbi:MAG: hypothetical protein GPJ52_10945 [Candidatus Heimdallarchaeota archaeon]|nr:hypothetical protein [Candidatus Heimdallarchaeota archaeon]